MKTAIRTLLQRAVGTSSIVEILSRIDRNVARLAVKHGSASSADIPPSANYEVYPGTPYSKIALPLDYPPSRDMRPRWGATHPLIKPLVDWIQPHHDVYRRLLAAMSMRAPAMSRIALDFDAANLPEPAWRGIPY